MRALARGRSAVESARARGGRATKNSRVTEAVWGQADGRRKAAAVARKSGHTASMTALVEALLRRYNAVELVPRTVIVTVEAIAGGAHPEVDGSETPSLAR
ncbi:hypothetical protein ACODT5_32750 [Streptomyces sp. 5.8]|uniref:hypothetical protein n=1 Tax=Streptomyces sp. 5.8 TaxID=3406571 RepID=UPI003BB5EEE6